MKTLIAIVSISFAAALSCGAACAGRDGGQILYQAQVLERIKQAANTDVRAPIKRPMLAYWDARRSPSQTR
jgi:hypothetical protein